MRATRQERIERRLACIEAGQARIERAIERLTALAVRSTLSEEIIMTIGEELLDQVAGITDATTAVEAAVNGLLDRIADSTDDPAVVQAIGDLRGLTSRLTAAALKGTIADPEPSDEGDGTGVDDGTVDTGEDTGTIDDGTVPDDSIDTGAPSGVDDGTFTNPQ